MHRTPLSITLFFMNGRDFAKVIKIPEMRDQRLNCHRFGIVNTTIATHHFYVNSAIGINLPNFITAN